METLGWDNVFIKKEQKKEVNIRNERVLLEIAKGIGS